jgi:hypothetical protein
VRPSRALLVQAVRQTKRSARPPRLGARRAARPPGSLGSAPPRRADRIPPQLPSPPKAAERPRRVHRCCPRRRAVSSAGASGSE